MSRRCGQGWQAARPNRKAQWLRSFPGRCNPCDAETEELGCLDPDQPLLILAGIARSLRQAFDPAVLKAMQRWQHVLEALQPQWASSRNKRHVVNY